VPVALVRRRKAVVKECTLLEGVKVSGALTPAL
jgi:hypothetical protein